MLWFISNKHYGTDQDWCRLWSLDHTGEVLQDVLDEYDYCAFAERKMVSAMVEPSSWFE